MLGGAGGFGGGSGSVSTPGHQPLGGGGGGLGGAVFNDGGSVAVTGSTFTANAAAAGSGVNSGSAYGGAVFSRNGNLTITASTLSANTAASGGRNVYVLADSVSGGGGDAANTGMASYALTNNTPACRPPMVLT